MVLQLEKISVVLELEYFYTKIKKVCIGKDNQWSFQILIRTSDSHAILDSAGNCINKGGDVIIGEHVWLAAQVRILKGVSIAKGCIVGCGSIGNFRKFDVGKRVQ